MKWIYKITFCVFLIFTIVSAAGSLFFYSRVNATPGDPAYAFHSNPRYHFSLIVNNEGDIYWEDFKRGALAAATAFHVALEINPVADPNVNRKTTEYVHIANKSGVDGIIVAGEKTPEYIAALEAATDQGINIIVGTTAPVNSARLCYVGTNQHEFFKSAALLIKQIGGEDSSIDLAVILPSVRDDGVIATKDDMEAAVTLGLKSVGINIANRLLRTSELLGAEDQIRSILTENPDIDVIFCTNAKDTVAAAHVIVERNLVGKVKIIGTDITNEILSYVKKDVIYGVLDRNGYNAGYQSVEALYDSMGDTFGTSTSYIDIKIGVYTSQNIFAYGKS